MKIYLGSDHQGFMLKEALESWLRKKGHEVEDVGGSSLRKMQHLKLWGIQTVIPGGYSFVVAVKAWQWPQIALKELEHRLFGMSLRQK